MSRALEEFGIWGKTMVFNSRRMRLARKFNGGAMPKVHEKWASRILHTSLNSGNGPDLFDGDKFVEIKFTLVNPKFSGKTNGVHYPRAWTVLENQMEYNDIFLGVGFWGLGVYELDRAVESIRTDDKQALEKMVVHRELYVVPWKWMDMYPPNHAKTYRYPKFNDLPQVISRRRVHKGYIHFTEGVDPDLFSHHPYSRRRVYKSARVSA